MVFTGSRMDFDWSLLIWRENFVRSHLDERPWPRGASIRTQCQNPGNDHDRRPETPESNAFEMPESVSAEAPVPIRITVDNDYPPGAWERVVEALAVKLDVRLSIGVPHTFTNSGDSPCIVVASGARSILEACSKAAASPETTRGLVLISGLPAADTARPAVPMLLVRGRQSARVTHEAGVSAFENLPLGRIVELEGCGDEPHAEQPDALASSIIWFAENLPETRRD